jgi:hypothetical protein
VNTEAAGEDLQVRRTSGRVSIQPDRFGSAVRGSQGRGKGASFQE